MTDESQKLPLLNTDNNVVGAPSLNVAPEPGSSEGLKADSVKSSSVDIPVNLTEKLHDFEDAPREDDPVYISEVVERTQKASSEASKPNSGTNTNSDNIDPTLELDSGLDAFLEQLNITRKQFYSFLIVFIILLFGVVLSFYFLFKFFSGTAEEVKVIGDVKIEQTQNADDLINDDNSKDSFFSKISNLNPFKSDDKNIEPVSSGKVSVKEDINNVETKSDSTVVVANTIAAPRLLNVTTNSLNGVKKIGQTKIQENRISYYLRTYRKVKNIYNTDLFSYLSQVPDRNRGFEAFLVQFKGSLEESRLAYQSLSDEIAQYDARVKKLQEDASLIENAFFDSLDGLESEVIAERLKAFQDISQKKDIANAELKARQAISVKYSKSIPLIESKIKAIEVNKDPFVKGVKVVDYEQIDLDLIIGQ